MSDGRVDREYYDRPGYFDEGTGHLTDPASRFQRYRVREVLRLYEPDRDERVLDLGCGWGTFSFALAPKSAEVIGLDFSERAVALCRGRQEREPHPNLSFVRADAGETGLEAESFDVVVAADLLEHLYPEDTVRVIRESHRLLKRGGRLVLWTPNPGHFLEGLRRRGILLRPDPTHVDYETMEGLRERLATAGFNVEKAYFAPSHLPVLSALERTFQAFLPLLRRRIAVLARKP